MIQDALATDLVWACKEFHRGRRNGDDGDGGRKGACLTLVALTRYMLAARPDIKDQLEPLHFLLAALGDLDVDRRDRMLAKEKKNGRPSASLRRELLQQTVAVTVAILMDGGQREKAAEAYVQRKLKKLGQAISIGTVGKWRSEVWADLPKGVGLPRKPDLVTQPMVPSSDRTDLYLERWFEWRRLQSFYDVATKQPLISANAFVDLVLSEGIRLYLD